MAQTLRPLLHPRYYVLAYRVMGVIVLAIYLFLVWTYAREALFEIF